MAVSEKKPYVKIIIEAGNQDPRQARRDIMAALGLNRPFKEMTDELREMTK